MTHAVAIVPALNRADTVGATVTALRTVADVLDVIVVDDGSRDRTAAAAAAAGARVIELARNRGKGAAIAAGIAASGAPDVYLLIDADLGGSAALAGALLEPVAAGTADMCIGVMADPDELAESADQGRKGGFGFVKRFAAHLLQAETGQAFAEPLSGQRAVRGPLLRSLHLAPGFGLEIGLTLDAADRGAAISEVAVGFTHRQTGRDLSGLAHRARIGRHVYLAAVSRIGGLKTNCLLVASLLSRVRLPVWPRSQQPRRTGHDKPQRVQPQQARHRRGQRRVPLRRSRLRQLLRPAARSRRPGPVASRLRQSATWRRATHSAVACMRRFASRLRRG